MSDFIDFLSVIGQIVNFIGELATLPSFPDSVWERNCQRNSVAPLGSPTVIAPLH